jgi:tetratricopeptide (TPR) repeat protein
VSQSPEKALRLQRYEDGWEIINRLIREDFTWGGYERKCLHVACDDGAFADISAASGIDFLDDGRAMSILDIDRDGRPDMLLRNRTSPQVRLLRNTWPHAGKSVWIRLEGGPSNRGAVGARVTVTTRAGRRAKEVQAGNLFLSQSSRWLCFGLGAAEIPSGSAPGEVRAEVRWPGGRIQDLGVLAPGKRFRVREGEPPVADPAGAAAATALEAAAPPPPTATPAVDPVAVATWLIEPLPAPDFSLSDPRSGGKERHGPARYRGAPLLLHFAAPTCAVCLSERGEVLRAERLVEEAGGRMLHLVAAPESSAEEATGFIDRMGFRAPAVVADRPTLLAYNLVHKHLWSRRRELGVPATFLLDEKGAIVRAYRGRTRAEDLAADLKRIPRTREERIAAALPFPGTLHADTFHRDLLGLGNAFFEAGLADLARATFGEAAGRVPGDVDSLFNHALSLAESGRHAEAEAVYRKVIDLAPGLDDARNNLGILLARSGREEEARDIFRSIVERNPAHAEAALNHGNALLREGRVEEAVKLYREALLHDPESAPFHRQLGFALYRAGDHATAMASYRRAIEIDPFDAEAKLGLAILLIATGSEAEAKKVSLDGLARNPANPHLLNTLGMAHAGLGEEREAIAALEKAIAADPGFDRPYLNLARLHAAESRPRDGAEVLRRLLAVHPDHPAAAQLLAEMR